MDRAIIEFISNFAGEFFILDITGVIFAKYIPFLILFLFLVFILYYKGWKKRLFAFIFTSLGLVISNGIIANVIEFFYNKPRPFEILDIEPLISSSLGHSFPSSHASFFFTLALCVFILNRKWGSWFLVFAILNGLARIFVGIHWPIDIIGGIIVAVVSFSIVYLLLEDYLDTIMNEKKEKAEPVV